MHRIRKQQIPTMIAVVLLPLLGGCAVLAVGAVAAGATLGAIKYNENEAMRDYQAGLQSTWDATGAQLGEMGYPIAEGVTASETGGAITVRDADVSVTKVDEECTRVRVRFGTFESDEHRAQARQLLEGIAVRVGE